MVKSTRCTCSGNGNDSGTVGAAALAKLAQKYIKVNTDADTTGLGFPESGSNANQNAKCEMRNAKAKRIGTREKNQLTEIQFR